MSLGLTYFAMKKLLDAKSLYMANWTIGLYATSTPFNPTRVVSDYTSGGNVPSFNTYAPQPVGLWSAAFMDAMNRVIVQAPLVVWTPVNALAPGPVWGYYLLDAAGNLVGAQDNPAGPIVVGGNLLPFTVFPQFQEGAF